MGLFDGTPLERPVLCDRCGEDQSDCRCPPPTEPDTPHAKQTLKVRFEKRKRGKVVTVVAGFSCSKEQMRQTLTALKNDCGAGGTLDGSNLEIQGNHVARIRECLSGLGYRLHQ